MKRRTISIALIVLGVLVLAVAIASATALRSSDSASLSLPERPDAPVVISEAGVLDAVSETVTVRATAADDEPITLAVGRAEDVEAWVGDTEHVRITGLSSWEELTVEVVEGTESATEVPTDGATAGPTEGTSPTAGPTAEPTAEPTAASTAEPAPASTTAEPAPASTAEITAAPPAEGTEAPTAGEEATTAGALTPAGSDLWVVEATSTGSVELEWTDEPGRWSLVAATDGSGPAPAVEFEWGREASTPWLVPGIVLGTLLLLAGVVLLVLDERAAREARRPADASSGTAPDMPPIPYAGDGSPTTDATPNGAHAADAAASSAEPADTPADEPRPDDPRTEGDER